MKIPAICLVVSLFLVSSVEAATINVFGQNTGGNTIVGNETGGVTTITGVNVPVTITTLNEMASNINAFFNLNATSTGAATNVVGDLWSQPYSGSFSITNGGFNYLSGQFAGVTLGLEDGKSLVFGAAQPPLFLDFTSDVLGMPLGDPSAMSLAFTNLFPGVTIVNNSFGDFTSNVSGTFSAEPLAAVPEPATMILLGTGLLAAFKSRTLKNKQTGV